MGVPRVAQNLRLPGCGPCYFTAQTSHNLAARFVGGGGWFLAVCEDTAAVSLCGGRGLMGLLPRISHAESFTLNSSRWKRFTRSPKTMHIQLSVCWVQLMFFVIHQKGKSPPQKKNVILPRSFTRVIDIPLNSRKCLCVFAIE